MRRLFAALACAALCAPAASSARPPSIEWRAARWGMTEEEVLKAFPGEASRLDPPQKLADGNVVAIGIDTHAIGATPFRVRFVFDPGGKLALVSLRSDPKTYAGVEAFQATRAALVAELGPAAEETSDDNFIDMRQVTWRDERGRIDLKYIPGTLVVLHAAPSQQPAGPLPLLQPDLAPPRVPAAVREPKR